MSASYINTTPGRSDYIPNPICIYTAPDSCIIMNRNSQTKVQELKLSDEQKKTIDALPLDLPDWNYIECDREMSHHTYTSDLVEIPFHYGTGETISVQHAQLFPIISAYSEELMDEGRKLAEEDIDQSSEDYAETYCNFSQEDQGRAMIPDQYYEQIQCWLPQVIAEQLIDKRPEAMLPVWYKLCSLDFHELLYQKATAENDEQYDDVPF